MTSPIWPRLGTAFGSWGACSAAGAGDWTAFVAFIVPALGFALYAVAARPTAR